MLSLFNAIKYCVHYRHCHCGWGENTAPTHTITIPSNSRPGKVIHCGTLYTRKYQTWRYSWCVSTVENLNLDLFIYNYIWESLWHGVTSRHLLHKNYANFKKKTQPRNVSWRTGMKGDSWWSSPNWLESDILDDGIYIFHSVRLMNSSIITSWDHSMLLHN